MWYYYLRLGKPPFIAQFATQFQRYAVAALGSAPKYIPNV